MRDFFHSKIKHIFIKIQLRDGWQHADLPHAFPVASSRRSASKSHLIYDQDNPAAYIIRRPLTPGLMTMCFHTVNNL